MMERQHHNACLNTSSSTSSNTSNNLCNNLQQESQQWVQERQLQICTPFWVITAACAARAGSTRVPVGFLHPMGSLSSSELES